MNFRLPIFYVWVRLLERTDALNEKLESLDESSIEFSKCESLLNEVNKIAAKLEDEHDWLSQISLILDN